MGRVKRRTVVGGICALGLLLPVVPASADRGPWPDRNDGARGPLAIEKIEIGHDSYHSSTLNIVFEKAVSPESFGRNDFLAIEMADGRGRRADYILFYGASRGQFETFSYDPQTDQVGRGGYWHRRPSPRELKIFNPEVGLPLDLVGYRFRIASYSSSGNECARGCSDAVPNSNWLIHDWTKPTLGALAVPEWSIQARPRPVAKVKWGASDRGLAGLSRRTLWTWDRAAGEWKVVRSTRDPGTSRDEIKVVPGTKARFSVTAVDGAGNKMRSHVVSTRVPLDDTTQVSDTRYFGLWSQEQSDSAYLNTLHVSKTPLDTFSFAAKAKLYCIVYQRGENWGRARFTVGETVTELDQANPYLRSNVPSCLTFSSRHLRTATVEVLNGVINLDGIYFE